MSEPTLEQFGFDAEWQRAFARVAGERSVIGRIVSVHYGGSFVRTAAGVVLAVTSGRVRKGKRSETASKPAVGDWVSLRPQGDDGPALLESILPRRGQLVRRAAGGNDLPQIVAANVDLVLVCMAFGINFNVRRMQRYLALAELGGTRVAIVLTKCDGQTAEEIAARSAEASEHGDGAPVFAISSISGVGLAELSAALGLGTTAVLLGSSGVGKSTLLNALAGTEHMAAAAVREKDDKGRHTTTHREMFLLPSGALVIDTPGLREVGLVGEENVGTRRPRRGSQRR